MKKDNPTETTEKKKKSFIIRLLMKNPLASFFFIVILALSIYGYIKIKVIIDNNKIEIESLIATHKQTVDSLKLHSLEQTITTFSWAVRSELIRDNIDQVDQFFQLLIKDPKIEIVNLINPESNFIMLSTDKKLEK